MTRDDSMRMALDAGVFEKPTAASLERFAAAAYAAGQADERKRILAICNEVSAEWFNYSGGADECIRRIEKNG